MMHPAHLASKSASKVPVTSVRSLQLSRPSRESRRGRFSLELTPTSTVSAHWSLSRRHSFGFPPSTNGGELFEVAGVISDGPGFPAGRAQAEELLVRSLPST